MVVRAGAAEEEHRNGSFGGGLGGSGKLAGRTAVRALGGTGTAMPSGPKIIGQESGSRIGERARFRSAIMENYSFQSKSQAMQ